MVRALRSDGGAGAERVRDIVLVDDTGQLLAKRHITDDATGYQLLLDLLAEYGDIEETPIPVAIGTSTAKYAINVTNHSASCPVTVTADNTVTGGTALTNPGVRVG